MDLAKHDRYDYVPLIARKDYSWPGGKRLAVFFCNNIEVFGFLTGLGSDGAVVGAPQSTRNYAWRDYGNRVGQWYLFDLFDELGLSVSHNVNSLVFEECPEIAGRIRERGDEVVGHGRTNAERQDHLSAAEEARLIGFREGLGDHAAFEFRDPGAIKDSAPRKERPDAAAFAELESRLRREGRWIPAWEDLGIREFHAALASLRYASSPPGHRITSGTLT